MNLPRPLVAAAVAALACLAAASARAGEPLKAGAQAPDFTAPLSDGTTFTLSKSLNRAPIVLYFYPKDFTPGCTKEACSLRDAFPKFQDYKATVIGVSYDSIDSHKAFVAKHKLPFPLASDSDRTVAKAYGVDGLLVAKRATFIIGKDGKILWADPKVDPSKHSDELERALASFAKKKP